jgi:hypothetical protein
VMFSTSETRVASGSTFRVKFSDFQAYKWVLKTPLTPKS